MDDNDEEGIEERRIRGRRNRRRKRTEKKKTEGRKRKRRRFQQSLSELNPSRITVEPLHVLIFSVFPHNILILLFLV